MELVHIPGRGRSLIAVDDIPYGTRLYKESPLVSTPSPHAYDTSCHTCLKPIPAPREKIMHKPKDMPRFCSVQCEDHAEQHWFPIARRAEFFPNLIETCRETSSKFPLMVARLACMKLMNESKKISTHNSGMRDEQLEDLKRESKVLCGNPLEDFEALCFANMHIIPHEWVFMHSLMNKALSSAFSPHNSGADDDINKMLHSFQQQHLDKEWFSWVLSRISLNAFRVDTIPLLATSDPLQDHAVLLKSALSAHEHTTPVQGSAVYLLSSMLNHSCEANVDVTFPENNHTISVVAATNIEMRQELTISYIDSGLPREARQHKLEFAYGFRCHCPRCQDEM